MKCVICQIQFTNNSDVFVTLCGHIFDRVCIIQSLERSPVCPVCGEGCSIDSIHKVFVTFDRAFTTNHFQEQIESLNHKLTSKINHIKTFKEGNRIQKDNCLYLMSDIHENELRKNRIYTRINQIRNGINDLNGMVPSLRKSIMIKERRKLSLRNLLSNKHNSVDEHKKYIKSIKAQIINENIKYDTLVNEQHQEKQQIKNKLQKYKMKLEQVQVNLTETATEQ
ncbi:uncharacterized protein LOC109609317 [Aethina tumida]|uniref:uncharacterized protein LOC109609317 n=1 Tax=Aethina tumida TaxID=116153 RepID=UPI002147BD19|nr:uncharacterized protein LOC109609317 [Aethina tumida]